MYDCWIWYCIQVLQLSRQLHTMNIRRCRILSTSVNSSLLKMSSGKSTLSHQVLFLPDLIYRRRPWRQWFLLQCLLILKKLFKSSTIFPFHHLVFRSFKKGAPLKPKALFLSSISSVISNVHLNWSTLTKVSPKLFFLFWFCFIYLR